MRISPYGQTYIEASTTPQNDRLRTNDSGEFKARFIIFCPTEYAIKIEDKITKDFMDLWYLEVVKQGYGSLSKKTNMS